jgi:hypothetical protein
MSLGLSQSEYSLYFNFTLNSERKSEKPYTD